MCPRLLFIFNHNKKYSRQQNGIVEKNNYMLMENVQSFKHVMQAHLNHFGRQIKLLQLQHVCEGMIKYIKKLCIAKSSLQMNFFDTNKNLYIFKSFI
jgi:uncharacterized C2H2 Zn-finger protein